MAKIKRKAPPTKLGVRRLVVHGTMPLERYRRIVITIDGFRAAIHNIIEDELKRKFQPKGGDLTDAMEALHDNIIIVMAQIRTQAFHEYDQEV